MTMQTLPGRWCDPALIGAPAEGPCRLVPARGRARRAWIWARGPIPSGLLVLHHCDEPRCVELRHLFLGTQSDNIADAKAKGRHVPPPRTSSWSEDRRAKTVASLRGLKLSDAHREKLRKAWENPDRKRQPTAEERQRISDGIRRAYAEGRRESRKGLPRTYRRSADV